MADAFDVLNCSDKNFTDKGSSDESTDSNPARDFSTEKQKSSQDPKVDSSKISKKKQNAIVKQEWKRRFRYLSYSHFLLHTRSKNENQTGEDPPPTQKKKGQRLGDIYADDKGYLQGEIYKDLESDEELGFSGEVCKELNLMPSDSHGDRERHSKDTESFRADLQTDGHIPEIIVAPSARFVREIFNGK